MESTKRTYRPRTNTPTERLSLAVRADVRDALIEAASLRGKSLSAFLAPYLLQIASKVKPDLG